MASHSATYESQRDVGAEGRYIVGDIQQKTVERCLERKGESFAVGRV